MDWMLVSPHGSVVEILTPNVILRGGTFGLVVLLKRPQEQLCCFHQVNIKEEDRQQPRTELSPEANHAGTLIIDF